MNVEIKLISKENDNKVTLQGLTKKNIIKMWRHHNNPELIVKSKKDNLHTLRRAGATDGIARQDYKLIKGKNQDTYCLEEVRCSIILPNSWSYLIANYKLTKAEEFLTSRGRRL